MKALIVYSSLTGNTKMVAEAMAEAVPGCDLYPVEEAPEAKGYDLVAVGGWADKGQYDAKARAYLEKVSGCKLALFGTMGVGPESQHAADFRAKAAELAENPARGNTVLGTWVCQGKIDPKVIEAMKKFAGNVHPMTPERIARHQEAAKHPDMTDLANAKAFILSCAAEAKA